MKWLSVILALCVICTSLSLPVPDKAKDAKGVKESIQKADAHVEDQLKADNAGLDKREAFAKDVHEKALAKGKADKEKMVAELKQAADKKVAENAESLKKAEDKTKAEAANRKIMSEKSITEAKAALAEKNKVEIEAVRVKETKMAEELKLFKEESVKRQQEEQQKTDARVKAISDGASKDNDKAFQELETLKLSLTKVNAEREKKQIEDTKNAEQAEAEKSKQLAVTLKEEQTHLAKERDELVKMAEKRKKGNAEMGDLLEKTMNA